MSARIDHAEKARTELDFVHEWMAEEGQTDATQLASALEAQVHATLALVEQQRIANMQTERSVLLAQAAGRDDLTAASMLERAEALGRQIREGLAL